MSQINLSKKSKLKFFFLFFAICFVPFCGTNAQDVCDDSCSGCQAGAAPCTGECEGCGLLAKGHSQPPLSPPSLPSSEKIEK